MLLWIYHLMTFVAVVFIYIRTVTCIWKMIHALSFTIFTILTMMKPVAFMQMNTVKTIMAFGSLRLT